LLSSQTIQSLFLIFMGTMDCLTTAIGTSFFGTQELNPVIAGLVNSNLPAFLALKLTVTVAVCFLFIFADKTLMQARDKNSASFKIASKALKIAYFSVMLLFAVVVTNNILVLLRLIMQRN